MDVPLVLPLPKTGDGSLAVVGGKAANLGGLLDRGFPVPEGFCVTTAGYRLMAAAPEVRTAMAALDGAPTSRPAGAAERIRDAIQATPVPPEVCAAVLAAYQGFDLLDGPVAVAVRSSATAEDLPDASFAGQQDTFLNVVGETAVVEAVRACWASLWTRRAVGYREQAGIDHRSVSLAVVVQRLVVARVAGVLFTADPVTGNLGHTVIDASPGLGEAVVSGAVNPDHVVLDSATGDVLRQRVGEKAIAIRPAEGGGTIRAENPGGAERTCLTSAELQTLVSLGQLVANGFGAPQDIEWALEETTGRIWLTQTRPITTLYPVPRRLADAPGEPRAASEGSVTRAYFCASSSWQGMTRPLTPMGMSGLRLAASSVADLFGVCPEDPALGPGAFAEAGMRMFLDLTPAIRSASGRRFLPMGLALTDSRAVAVVRGLFDDPRFSVTDHRGTPFLRRLGWAALRHGVPLRILEAVARPGAARRRVDRMAGSLARRTAVPGTATPRQRLAAAERMIGESVGPLWARIVPITGVGMGMFGLARRLAGGEAAESTVQGVLRGLPDNVTTEMDLALWRLAQTIRADPAATATVCAGDPGDLAREYLAGGLPEPIQRGLAGFLDQYGHRAVAESDLGMPRWSDDPTHLFATVHSYLRMDDPDKAPDAQFARAEARALEDVAELVRLAGGRTTPRGWLMTFALRRARALLGLREQAKFYNIWVLAQARRQILAIGDGLRADGVIDRAEDVLFLDLPTVRAVLEGGNPAGLRGTIAANRQEYDRESRRRRVPQIILSTGCDPEAEAPASAEPDGSLRGTPASVGVVSGPARVVLDPMGAQLCPGEVLVAPSTDPGWTPLFLTAGALVMETGGVNSHGAVVAREYGIPSVVGVQNATTSLHTGQMVVVNGSAGTVTPQ